MKSSVIRRVHPDFDEYTKKMMLEKRVRYPTATRMILEELEKQEMDRKKKSSVMKDAERWFNV